MSEPAGKPAPRPRAKYLARGYLHDTAADMRRLAARLIRDAEDAAEDQAEMMLAEAERILGIAERFDSKAESAPGVDPQELPFS